MTEADPGSGGMMDPPPVVGERGRPGSAAARPLVLLEPFDGTGSWSDWWFRFLKRFYRERMGRHTEAAVAPGPPYRTCSKDLWSLPTTRPGVH